MGFPDHITHYSHFLTVLAVSAVPECTIPRTLRFLHDVPGSHGRGFPTSWISTGLHTLGLIPALPGVLLQDIPRIVHVRACTSGPKVSILLFLLAGFYRFLLENGYPYFPGMLHVPVHSSLYPLLQALESAILDAMTVCTSVSECQILMPVARGFVCSPMEHGSWDISMSSHSSSGIPCYRH